MFSCMLERITCRTNSLFLMIWSIMIFALLGVISRTVSEITASSLSCSYNLNWDIDFHVNSMIISLFRSVLIKRNFQTKLQIGWQPCIESQVRKFLSANMDLTHLPLDKLATIVQTTCIFLNEKFQILIRNSLKFVPKGPINNNLSLV